MRKMAARRRKKRMNTLSIFAILVPFRGNFVVASSRSVKPGQTKSNRSVQVPAIAALERQCRLRAASPSQEYPQTFHHE
jgi:hypothetical protein